MVRMRNLLAAPLHLCSSLASAEATANRKEEAAQSVRVETAVCLASARPAGTALLLRRPWALLLRLLLQLGMSQSALLSCCSLVNGVKGTRLARAPWSLEAGVETGYLLSAGEGSAQGQRAAAAAAAGGTAGDCGQQGEQWHAQSLHDDEAQAEAREVQEELLAIIPKSVHEVCAGQGRARCCHALYGTMVCRVA